MMTPPAFERPGFDVEVEATADARATLRLRGAVDLAADGRLLGAYERAAAAGASSLILDFTGVGYVDSGGIALIVELLVRARRDGLELHAIGLSDHYREIFLITRLADYIDLAGERSPTADRDRPAETGR